MVSNFYNYKIAKALSCYQKWQAFRRLSYVMLQKFWIKFVYLLSGSIKNDKAYPFAMVVKNRGFVSARFDTVNIVLIRVTLQEEHLGDLSKNT